MRIRISEEVNKCSALLIFFCNSYFRLYVKSRYHKEHQFPKSTPTFPCYSTQNTCRSADRDRVSPNKVKLQTNFELVTMNAFIGSESKERPKHFSSRSTHIWNKVTLQLSTSAVYTNTQRKAPNSHSAQQGSQCKYFSTLRCVHAITFAVENQ